MNRGMRLAGLALLLVSSVFARTEIKGVYWGFLKAEESPYLVTETLIVPEGRALLIEAGTVLEFASGAGLDIQGGSFAVDGDAQKPVVMQPARSGRYSSPACCPHAARLALYARGHRPYR